LQRAAGGLTWGFGADAQAEPHLGIENGEGGEEPADGGEIHAPPHLARLHLVAEKEAGEGDAGARVRPFFRVGWYAISFEEADLVGLGGAQGFGGDVQGSAGMPAIPHQRISDLFSSGWT